MAPAAPFRVSLKPSGHVFTTTLQRSDFGVAGFDKMLGEDVDVHINVEAGVKA
jgi:polyisoprenoid-binding protein YceI